VFKGSAGAGSDTVRLAPDRRAAQALAEDVLAQSFWERFRDAGPKPMRRAWRVAHRRWFRSKLRDTLLRRSRVAPAYWQEFVAGCEGDLRVTCIGARYAQWFRRRNRPGDFRASGSGLLSYEPLPPEEIVRYCLGLNRRFGFDSMAYDVLETQEGFLITEMSHIYPDWGVADGPGRFELDADGALTCVEGSVQPQALWVAWALEREGVAEGVAVRPSGRGSG
jgi:hypothetical protein